MPPFRHNNTRQDCKNAYSAVWMVWPLSALSRLCYFTLEYNHKCCKLVKLNSLGTKYCSPFHVLCRLGRIVYPINSQSWYIFGGFLFRARRGEPAWWSVCERAAAARCGEAENRRVGTPRRTAMRHFPPASRQPRLRQQDPGQVSLIHVLIKALVMGAIQVEILS